MKKLHHIYFYLLFACAISFFSCNNEKKDADNDGKLPTDLINNPNSAQGEKPENAPAMVFAQDTYDFGEIVQGERVNHEFSFTNTGKSDLIISNAHASCGCTVPEYPKEPIKPGESGVIKVSYNSEGRKDAFNKTVTVTVNTFPNENKIYIKGVVIVPKDQ